LGLLCDLKDVRLQDATVVVDRLETTSAIGGIALPALPVGYRIATFAAFGGLNNLFADGAEGQGFIRRFRGESAEITKAAGFPQHMIVQFVVVPHIGGGFLCRILGLDRWEAGVWHTAHFRSW